MPADYEMMIASSPPVFSHSPPVSSCLGANLNYLCGRGAAAAAFADARRKHMNPKLRVAAAAAAATASAASAASSGQDQAVAVLAKNLHSLHLRPCLKPDEPTDAAKHKKKVVFADDKGFSLTHIRVMSEPSHCPPLWTVEFIAQVTKGAIAEVAPAPWEVTFPQPASDYLNFRQQLEQNNVSLENVIVKENEELIMGTIKVKNLSFHKQVLVRVTFDEWETHEDAHGTFVQNSPAAMGPPSPGTTPGCIVLYDTFSFQLRLQPRAKRVEFCICYTCDGHEYWDNNQNKNYVLVKSSVPLDKSLANNNRIIPASGQQRFNDALLAKLDSWSEFASWNHLVNDSPYW